MNVPHQSKLYCEAVLVCADKSHVQTSLPGALIPQASWAWVRLTVSVYLLLLKPKWTLYERMTSSEIIIHNSKQTLPLRSSTITPVVSGQAWVTSDWVDWAGVRWYIPTLTHPFCFLLSERVIEEERKTVREGLFVRFQEQSGLEALAGQPGPQREKKKAFLTWRRSCWHQHTKNNEQTDKEREKGGDQLNNHPFKPYLVVLKTETPLRTQWGHFIKQLKLINPYYIYYSSFVSLLLASRFSTSDRNKVRKYV